MKEFLRSKYNKIFSDKGWTPEQIQSASDFFCSDKIEESKDFSHIEFSTEDLVLLAEFLPTGEPIYLKNFISFLLANKKYDNLSMFFSKMFISHIGKVNYTSKNVKIFDITERSFDRFMEIVIWTEIPFKDYIDLFFNVVKGNTNSAINRWKRPVIDYFLDLLLSDEKGFYKFVFDNFAQYGIATFEIFINNNVPSALPKLVDYWLKNEFDEKRQVKNILKQHFTEVREYVATLQKAYQITTPQLVDLLLIFKNEKDANEMLKDIYFKEKDTKLKKIIVENIHIESRGEPLNLAQIKKNSQRYNVEEKPKFLDTKLSDFPELVIYNNEKADEKLLGYFMNSYANLCSPYASFEVDYFHKIFEPKSLNKFCDFIAEKLINRKPEENEWAYCLIAQNSTSNGALNIIKKFIQKDSKSPRGADTFVKMYIYEHKEETLKLFYDLDKDNYDEKKVLDILLKGIIESNLYEPMEIELLRDKMVPYFDLENGKIVMGDYTLSIEQDWTVGIKGDVTKTPKEVLIEQKRLAREIERQSKRLNTAFSCGRLWSLTDWQKYIMEQPLMHYFAEKLLWGKYRDNRLISVFKIKSKEKINLVSIESDSMQDYKVGIFHLVEFNEPDWQYLFDGKPAPFNQLYRDIYPLSNYNQHSSLVSRFNGFIVNISTFFDRLEKNNWKFGLANLSNELKSMIKINRELGILCEIDFSPIPQGKKEGNTTLGEVRFYRLDSVLSTGNNWVTNKSNSLELGVLNSRYFSDIIFEISSAGKK